jgi:hypothetical protein
LQCALAAAFLLSAGLLTAQGAKNEMGLRILRSNYEPEIASGQEPDETAPANAPAALLVTVDGVVLNAANSQPVPRALVRIEGDAANGVLTNGEGRFELAGVPAGPQAFQVYKPGFRDPSATGEMSGDGAQSTEHNVLVAARMPDLVFTLAPTNSIRGQVSLSTGDEAGGIEIWLLKRTIEHGRAAWRPAKTVKTSDEGTYRFGELPDGVYVVYTNPLLESDPLTTLVEPGSGASIARNGYATVFYPDARELAGASRIRLAGGEQTEADINLTLEPFYAVTAKVFDPNGRLAMPEDEAGPGQAGGTLTPALMDTENHFLPYTAQYDAATRTVQATLPNGSYTLTVVTRSGAENGSAVDAGAAQSYAHPGYLAGSAQFSIAGSAVRNLQLALFYPHSDLLRLRGEQDANPSAQAGVFPRDGLRSAVRVSLGYAGEYRVDQGSEKIALNAGPDAFDLMLAPPFSFWVHTLVYGQGLCAGSLDANGVDLAREPLVLSYSGSAAPMEFTVRNDCARLNLTLPPELTELVAGIEPVYTVYVVPDLASTEDVQPLTLRPTSGGSLLVQGLTPGNYHVYTFTSPIDLEYRNPEVMAQLPTPGQAVTLSAGSTANLVLEVPGP